jgi:hypothetical protein
MTVADTSDVPTTGVGTIVLRRWTATSVSPFVQQPFLALASKSIVGQHCKRHNNQFMTNSGTTVQKTL